MILSTQKERESNNNNNKYDNKDEGLCVYVHDKSNDTEICYQNDWVTTKIFHNPSKSSYTNLQGLWEGIFWHQICENNLHRLPFVVNPGKLMGRIT